MNQSVMGSTFTRYKTPAFVNLDFKVTFTPQLLRKDLDLGLDAGAQVRGADAARVSATRDLIQSMIGQRLDRAGLRHAAAAAGAGVGDRTKTRKRGGGRWTFVESLRSRASRRWSLRRGVRAGLSQQAGARDHLVHAGQRDRHRRPRGDAEAVGVLGPAGDRRTTAPAPAAPSAPAVVAQRGARRLHAAHRFQRRMR